MALLLALLVWALAVAGILFVRLGIAAMPAAASGAAQAFDAQLRLTFLTTGIAFVAVQAALGWFAYSKMFGRMLHPRLGTLHFLLTFVGVHLVFVPMLAQGIMGHSRRYYDSTGYGYLAAAQPLHGLVTWATIGTAAAQLVFLANLLWGRRRGPAAGDNPWEATTLEWTTTSPPPRVSFAADPIEHRGANAYSVPGARRDFLVQTELPDAPRAQGGRE